MWGGTLHLYGHVHGAIGDTRHSCDVGVDRWLMRPVTLAEIREHLAWCQGPIEEELAEPGRTPGRRMKKAPSSPRGPAGQIIRPNFRGVPSRVLM